MPMIKNKTMDLSFSGIKTSVRNVLIIHLIKNREPEVFEFQIVLLIVYFQNAKLLSVILKKLVNLIHLYLLEELLLTIL